jgi:hypothetical protein
VLCHLSVIYAKKKKLMCANARLSDVRDQTLVVQFLTSKNRKQMCTLCCVVVEICGGGGGGGGGFG